MLQNHTYTIKGMVCARCIHSLRSTVERSGFKVAEINLGKLVIDAKAIDSEVSAIIHGLIETTGFEVVHAKNELIVEKVKHLIQQRLRNPNNTSPIKLSAYLSEELKMGYHAIRDAFVKSEKISIEKFTLISRMDMVKEQLISSGCTLTDIAYNTGFSSVHHLSKQFKETVGMNPSEYRMKYSRN